MFLQGTSVIHRKELILIKPALAFALMYFCKHIVLFVWFHYFLLPSVNLLNRGKGGEGEVELLGKSNEICILYNLGSLIR